MADFVSLCVMQSWLFVFSLFLLSAWRNWQTRRSQTPPRNRPGSNPGADTKLMVHEGKYSMFLYSGVQTVGANLSTARARGSLLRN